MKELNEQVKQDIQGFFDTLCDVNTSRVFFNEKDFQVHLAKFLINSRNYDEVEMEYYVPLSMLDKKLIGTLDFPWVGKLYIDIVVRRGVEYLPIELKYKTKEEQAEFERFGIPTPNAEMILTDQMAGNIHRYAFWKDVRRVEMLIHSFPNSIKHGLCVFLTNDSYYMKKPRPGVKYEKYSMEDGVLHGKDMSWKEKETSDNQDPTKKKKNELPNFILANKYRTKWQRTCQQAGNIKVDSYYTIVEVPPLP